MCVCVSPEVNTNQREHAAISFGVQRPHYMDYQDERRSAVETLQL